MIHATNELDQLSSLIPSNIDTNLDSLNDYSSFSFRDEHPILNSNYKRCTFLSLPVKRHSFNQEFVDIPSNFNDFQKSFLLPHLLNKSFLDNSDNLNVREPWNQLIQLRIHAELSHKTDKSIHLLLSYINQLDVLIEQSCNSSHLIHSSLSWFEAFHPKRKVYQVDLFYEKAAVLWNLAALYSQIGTSQSLWTPKGIKIAVISFQKAAGCLLFIRDQVINKSRVKIDKSMSDLSHDTLNVALHLMLAQADECFFLKAEYGTGLESNYF